TVRVVTKWTAHPSSGSPTSGPQGTRPRLGLSPTTPQADAGIRIEPPPSLAPAIGTIPAPTTAPEPPDEPPAIVSGPQGLQVRPTARVSVVPRSPNSDVV